MGCKSKHKRKHGSDCEERAGREGCGCGPDCGCRSGGPCHCGQGCGCSGGCGREVGDAGGCGCGCAGTCGCGHGAGFHRRFATKAERAARLEAYLAELKAEAQAVEEKLAELR